MALKKVTINLPDETIEAIETYQREHNISNFTESLRRMIAMQKFLNDEIRNQGKILLQTSDGTTSRLLFK
jgi:hypothetical protein